MAKVRPTDRCLRTRRDGASPRAGYGSPNGMKVVLAFVVGMLAVRLVVLAAREVLSAPVLQRRNYRDHVAPTAAGMLAVLAVLGVEA